MDNSDSDEDTKIYKNVKNINYGHDIEHRTTIRIDNEIKNIDKNEYNRSFRNKDKSDRATVDQVLDSRISKIIYKLVNKGEINEINGCISTGKEANVYYAKGNKELAIKIYKTSILIFKDRERYIAGEFRFRHGYCKSNPRKMVALWAEKEVRNLKRLIQAGLKCPNPLILKSNLIVMEFIGKDGKAAPRLKDANIESAEEWENIYISIIKIMRILFKKCKLVHADFSEYNLLYYEKEIYIIDVAQAIEDYHLNALAFLRRDCANINAFFDRNGVETITNQQLFDIITIFDLKENIIDKVNDYRIINDEKEIENPNFKSIENGLFLNFEIPRGLKEEEVDKITGNCDIEEALIKLCGVVREKEAKEIFDENSDDEKDEEGEDEESEGEEIENHDNAQNVENKEIDTKNKKFDPFDGLSKAERKKKVKEENREKRKNKKFSKYEKAKMIKKTSGKK
jgi:RIO kinase 1